MAKRMFTAKLSDREVENARSLCHGYGSSVRTLGVDCATCASSSIVFPQIQLDLLVPTMGRLAVSTLKFLLEDLTINMSLGYSIIILVVIIGALSQLC